MGEILHALANGELITEPSMEIMGSKWKKANDLYCTLGDELLDRLNDDEKRLFNEYADAYSEANFIYSNERFISGYRLGVLMTIEIFEGKHDLLEKRRIKG